MSTALWGIPGNVTTGKSAIELLVKVFSWRGISESSEKQLSRKSLDVAQLLVSPSLLGRATRTFRKQKTSVASYIHVVLLRIPKVGF